jgi:hypothetical protein
VESVDRSCVSNVRGHRAIVTLCRARSIVRIFGRCSSDIPAHWGHTGGLSLGGKQTEDIGFSLGLDGSLS